MADDNTISVQENTIEIGSFKVQNVVSDGFCAYHALELQRQNLVEQLIARINDPTVRERILHEMVEQIVFRTATRQRIPWLGEMQQQVNDVNPNNCL